MQNQNGDWIVPAYLLENKQVVALELSNETHTRKRTGRLREGVPMGEGIVTGRVWTCDVCGHKWPCKSLKKPEKCPKCKTRLWNRDLTGYFPSVRQPRYKP
jgi:predicted Zn-ribbon and HTH transcriptional regulator